eukprot:Lithocolla_globosa_v1_NODE_975_length_3001_cov_30.149355.p2 type:complete len:123 gc:universal NODE_975_length_3001_cov_30.149355:1546-1914(+)
MIVCVLATIQATVAHMLGPVKKITDTVSVCDSFTSSTFAITCTIHITTPLFGTWGAYAIKVMLQRLHLVQTLVTSFLVANFHISLDIKWRTFFNSINKSLGHALDFMPHLLRVNDVLTKPAV